jgi:hypothetical protein
VDGIFNHDFDFGSCSHTHSERNPWWRLDIDGLGEIGTVKVWNRLGRCSDGACASRLSGAVAWVSNTSTPATAQDDAPVQGRCTVMDYNTRTLLFKCNAMGKYLFIAQWGEHKILSLCEVLVGPRSRAMTLGPSADKHASLTEACDQNFECVTCDPDCSQCARSGALVLCTHHTVCVH